MNRQEAHRIFYHCIAAQETFRRLPAADAVSEIQLARLEEPSDNGAFFRLVYRKLWGLLDALRNPVIDVAFLESPSNEWTESDIEQAEAIAAYYRRFGWPATCRAFGISPDNRKAQKLLASEWGRNRKSAIAGKPPGARRKVQVTDSNISALEEAGLSRTSIWRAKKRGWATISE